VLEAGRLELLPWSSGAFRGLDVCRRGRDFGLLRGVLRVVQVKKRRAGDHGQERDRQETRVDVTAGFGGCQVGPASGSRHRLSSLLLDRSTIQLETGEGFETLKPSLALRAGITGATAVSAVQIFGGTATADTAVAHKHRRTALAAGGQDSAGDDVALLNRTRSKRFDRPGDRLLGLGVDHAELPDVLWPRL
jgi:hypothetical protein